jgi:hypothetical protein
MSEQYLLDPESERFVSWGVNKKLESEQQLSKTGRPLRS